VNKRLRFATAKQVFETFATASADIEAKPADIEPLAFLQALSEGPTPEDGISFCAYLLPKREAVWWACQCIRAVEQPLDVADGKLLAVAEAWVNEPEEANRRAALTVGQNTAVKNPAAWAVLAAGWSGGSMVEDAERAVPPPNYLTAQAVRAAVLSALARVPTRSRRENLGTSIDLATKLMRAGGT
jgi:hypothetical protein